MNLAEPVINGYRIDWRVLREQAHGLCDWKACRGSCCSLGVLLNFEEQAQILAERELIQRFMPPERQDPALWFDEVLPDEPMDTRSGHRTGAVGTRAWKTNGRTHCIFLDAQARCVLQTASAAECGNPWQLKPFYCSLFPVCVEDGLITIADESAELLGVNCQRAEGALQPFYKVFAGELQMLLGKEGYAKLETLARAPA